MWFVFYFLFAISSAQADGPGRSVNSTEGRICLECNRATPNSLGALKSLVELKEFTCGPKCKALSDAILDEAKKPRRYAKFLNKKGMGRNPSQSKGMCASAVVSALRRTISPEVSSGHAISMANILRKDTKNFAELKVRTTRDVPPGSIIVYSQSGNRYGHIEVKTVSNGYCSDFCSSTSFKDYNQKTAKIISVFLPNEAARRLAAAAPNN